jgi:hypothetical protein
VHVVVLISAMAPVEPGDDREASVFPVLTRQRPIVACLRLHKVCALSAIGVPGLASNRAETVTDCHASLEAELLMMPCTAVVGLGQLTATCLRPYITCTQFQPGG